MNGGQSEYYLGETMFGIVTVVSGKDYQDFIPLFIYGVHQAYPDYHIEVYCKERLKRTVRRSLSSLEAGGSFTVRENTLSDFPNEKDNIKACRWLLNSRDFEQFDHVYLGDIDLIILPETPSLLDQHLDHCSTLGLPFSNIVRPYDSRGVIPQTEQDRMSGLHFIEPTTYFQAMDPVIERYRIRLRKPVQWNNEKILYAMLTEAFGDLPKDSVEDLPTNLGLPEEHAVGGVPFWDPARVLFRPYHGIHFGAFRLKNGQFKDSARINNFYYGKHYCEFLDQAQQDPIFHEIVKQSSRKTRKILRMVDTYVRNNKHEHFQG
jgi:hypothetical protein